MVPSSCWNTSNRCFFMLEMGNEQMYDNCTGSVDCYRPIILQVIMQVWIMSLKDVCRVPTAGIWSQDLLLLQVLVTELLCNAPSKLTTVASKSIIWSQKRPIISTDYNGIRCLTHLTFSLVKRTTSSQSFSDGKLIIKRDQDIFLTLALSEEMAASSSIDSNAGRHSPIAFLRTCMCHAILLLNICLRYHLTKGLKLSIQMLNIWLFF